MGVLPDTVRVSYDISYSPDPITVQGQVSADNQNIDLTVLSIGSLSVDLNLNKSAKITTQMQSALLFPLAKILEGKIASEIKSKADGKKMTIFQVQDIPLTSGDITVTLTPSALKLENFNSRLMLSGDLKIK